ncbi:MAG: hypothetical protein ACE5KM_15550 [Planctomycetaceae bacterium]
MQYKVNYWCERIFNNWQEATTYDFAFATAWIVVAGFLIARLTTRPVT